MAKNKKLKFVIDIPKGSKFGLIPLSNELAEKLFPKDEGKRTYTDYLVDFLGSKKELEENETNLNKLLHESLPTDIELNCTFCNGDSKDANDRNCQPYLSQMQVSYFLAGTSFVNIVLSNKHIYNDKLALKNLTLKYFDCLHFINGKGELYLDLDELAKYTINSGFVALSNMFRKSPDLVNLQVINDGLDAIDQKILDNELFEKDDDNYFSLQKRFLENKQRFYKEKLAVDEQKQLEEKKESLLEKKGKNKGKPTVTHYAMYYYYLQATGSYPYFENHPKGKLVAIDELIKEEKIKTTINYFQKVYNKIAHHQSNRIANNQKANIEYVANTMLIDYPKAQKLAFKELQEAQTKSR